MSSLQLTIGIVTIRERYQQLRRLLKSITTQRLPSENFEILLSPNMDPLEWKLLAEALGDLKVPMLKILEPGKRSLGQARNEILSLSQSSVLLYLDDDCWLSDDDHLSRRLTLHALHPDHVIGGKYSNKPEVKRNLYNDICNLWFDLDPQGWKVLGGNTSYPLSVVRNSGATFDSKKGYGGNESTLNLALWKKGVKFYKSESLAVHLDEDLSILDLGRKAFLQGQARAAESRLPLDRPTLTEIATVAFKRNFNLSHLGYFCLGQIGFLSKRLSQSFEAPHQQTQRIARVSEKAKDKESSHFPERPV